MPSPFPTQRPTGHLIIPAQGFNVARLPGASGDNDHYIWIGERWLSGPFAPSKQCTGDCAKPTGACARDPRFLKGHEFTYWAPLQFAGGSGAVRQFLPFQDSVTLEVGIAQ